MRRSLSILFLFALALVAAYPLTGVARADGPGISRLTGDTVVALDRYAGHDAADLAAAETVVELVSTSQDGGSIAFIVYGLAPSAARRVAAGEAGVDDAAADAVTRVREGATSRLSDQYQAMAGILSYLTGIDAPSGSSVFLVTNGRQDVQSENVREGLIAFSGLLAQKGWSVNPVMLPSASPEDREFLGRLAGATSGTAYDAGTAEGIAHLLSDVAGISPAGAIDATVAPDVPALKAFEIAPGTDHVTISFARQHRDVDITVFNPSGGAVTGERQDVVVFETPNTLVYSVEEPIPGTWSVRADGPGSSVLAGLDTRNPLEVALLQQPPLAAGEAGVLQAVVTVAGEPAPLSGAFIEATVRQPDGSTRVYRLEDRGSSGDEVAGDGVFATIVPASGAQGVNDAALELRWEQYGATIAGNGRFQTEVFPAVEVEAAERSSVLSGTVTVLARVEVTVDGYPHMVLPMDVRAIATSPDGERVDTGIVPRGVTDEGRAWQFDVQAVPPGSGEYAVDVSVTGEYVGRAFTAAAPGVVAAAEVTFPPPPVAPPVVIESGGTGVPVWVWPVAAIVALAATVALVRWSRKVRPYGYIYDDGDRLIADFAHLRRGLPERLLKKDRVDSAEVPGLLFRGGSFVFSRGQVELRYRRAEGDPSLRANSRPAGAVTRLDENTWLGVGGRLLTFVLSPRPAPAGAFGS